ncbi:MAG: N-(5'-phosphoribosyl)anthranilate isomerase [Dinoroseobacter sp.]|nr:N-(5'-phosphoribosyl)anthranilate isomerase [Dinoroseobacter sp.]
MLRSKRDVIDPEIWVTHLFSSRAAAEGGVVRRKARDVERIVGWEVFTSEIKRRGYRAVLNGGQVVVFCNAEPVRILE